ncbi:MAG: S1 RNA-binding domain-containing protein [Anaerolineae bacterium]|nr:S1 RNA-binding domain-containing protein [Anaerolineae bacterium]
MTESTVSSPASALEVKTKFKGKVIKITLAGVLVDIGQDLPGVIHISQLQKDKINKAADVVQVGQEVEVWVRRIKKDRIELTMIEPLGMEWNEINPEIIVKGKVVRLESYGAFVDFGAERPGLVHVSELSRGYIKSPNDIVKEGDEVEAVVLDVNRKKKQIRLSMKALEPEIEKIKPSKKDTNKGSSKRASKQDMQDLEISEEPQEPELTGMQIAWQAALDRANNKDTDEIKPERKRIKAQTDEQQEDILNRTLEKRIATGS